MENKAPNAPEPIIAVPGQLPSLSASGQSFSFQEWSGSGPDYLHIHHADDEAWHILEGTLTFKFADHEVDVNAGTSVFVPAGVAHAYYEKYGPARYLIILTPRLQELIGVLHNTPYAQHAEVMRQFESEIIA